MEKLWFGNAVLFWRWGASEMGAGSLLLKGRGGQFGATSLLLFLFRLAQGGVTSSICLDAVGLAPGAVVGGLAPLLGDQHPTGTGLEPGPQLILRAVIGSEAGWGDSFLVLVLLLV